MSLLTIESFAQNDSTRYINGLPVTEDDTVRQFPESDIGPRENYQAVAPGALPRKLFKTLESEELYTGWRDSTVYYDVNTRLYLVHVRSGESVKIFGLTEKGKPVTFSEISRSPD